MKKIKRILSLALASLVMGGLIFSTPINTTTANAEIYRGYTYTREKYYYAPQQKINGYYEQRVLFKMRHKHFPNRFKYYSQFLLYVGEDGYLKLKRHAAITDPVYIFDDAYMMIVTDECMNVRFKWLSNYKPKATAVDELDYLVEEFNKLKVGKGNRIMLVPRYWLGTVLFDTTKPLTALKRVGHNNFEKGYTDKDHKYSTSLRVDDDGLQEIKAFWGNEEMFTYP